MLRSALTLSLISLAAFSPAAETASARLVREVGDGYLQLLTRENPMRRLKLGLPIEKLPGVTLADEERVAKEASGLLARLTPVKRKELTHEESLSLDVLTRQLTLQIDAPKSFYYRFQVTPYLSPLGAVSQIFSALPLATAADRDLYLARLAEVPGLASAIGANLQTQADKGIRVPKPELDQVDGLLKAFAGTGEASPFRPKANRLASLATSDRDAFLGAVDKLVKKEAAPAVSRLAAAVSGDYRAKAPETVGMKQYPGGLDMYREFVKLHTTMDATPEQVHQIGLKNVARISAEMAAIREELGFKGTQAEFKESLRGNPRVYPKTPDEIGERLMSYITRIEPEVDHYFGRRPNAPYGVKRLDPQLEAGQTFGYYQIPTATEPRGYYNYNGSNLAERSLLNAGALIYHELIPGHHFQINLAFENPGIPEFRRESFDTAFTEGWGEYAAGLAGEMGMYKDAYDRYGRLSMEMFVSIRLVVDTGMNALGWSRERAIDYMKENAMESDTQILSETLRYSCDMPGQALAYKMGAMKILELREKAKAVLGPRFDIRRFHDWILASGSLPMTTLESHVQAFIDASKM
ncbi:MAG: DUF885 domain-containing protein [Vicinamibacteria bacterium]|nr:DUF885 domain-containing protein [Vicinamibacteria bacterium]